MTKLRLAVNNVAPVVQTRPYQTMYYGSAAAKIQDWSRIGRASTNVGAIRAAVVRLVTGQYYKAVIHGESGEVLYTMRRVGRKIEIFGMFMLPED